MRLPNTSCGPRNHIAWTEESGSLRATQGRAPPQVRSAAMQILCTIVQHTVYMVQFDAHEHRRDAQRWLGAPPTRVADHDYLWQSFSIQCIAFIVLYTSPYPCRRTEDAAALRERQRGTRPVRARLRGRRAIIVRLGAFLGYRCTARADATATTGVRASRCARGAQHRTRQPAAIRVCNQQPVGALRLHMLCG